MIWEGYDFNACIRSKKTAERILEYFVHGGISHSFKCERVRHPKTKLMFHINAYTEDTNLRDSIRKQFDVEQIEYTERIVKQTNVYVDIGCGYD